MAEAATELSYGGNASSADLTVNGSTAAVGPLTVSMAGFDLAAQAECTLGRGVSGTPPGSTDFGFTDTTYSLTSAQVQAGSLTGA